MVLQSTTSAVSCVLETGLVVHAKTSFSSVWLHASRVFVPLWIALVLSLEFLPEKGRSHESVLTLQNVDFALLARHATL